MSSPTHGHTERSGDRDDIGVGPSDEPRRTDLVGDRGVDGRGRGHRHRRRHPSADVEESAAQGRPPTARGGDVHGAASLGLARHRTGRAQLRADRRPRRSLRVHPPADRGGVRGQPVRRATRGRRVGATQRIAPPRSRPGMANGVGLGDQPGGTRWVDPLALRRHGALHRHAPAGRRSQHPGVEAAPDVRVEGQPRLGRPAAGAAPRLAHDARPRQAREAEARTAAHRAHLLPLRVQGDAARGVPAGDRTHEGRRRRTQDRWRTRQLDQTTELDRPWLRDDPAGRHRVGTR